MEPVMVNVQFVFRAGLDFAEFRGDVEGFRLVGDGRIRFHHDDAWVQGVAVAALEG